MSDRRLGAYWAADAGPREVVSLALPLILSTASFTIQVFVDRMFLAWYSRDAIAAAIPAVCVFWVLMGPLQGIVSFANTFVAQYHGACRPERIGSIVAQAVLFGLAGGIAVLGLMPFSEVLFRWIGHEEAVRELEVDYFKVLLFWAIPMLVSTGVSCFFGGLGRTWVVLALNLVATAVNIVLDYAMIFGHWGFPEMGIVGAGWASFFAFLVSAALSLALLWAADDRGEFRVRVWKTWSPHPELLSRLLKYGGPNGAMALVDVIAWTWFVLLVGRLGTAELAATNVVLNINMIAFMPLLGLSTATQIMVGQRLGEDRPDLASRATWSAFWVGLAFTVPFGVGYLAVPDWFLAVFMLHAEEPASGEWHGLVITLLRFVVVYMLFDMATLVFSGALRGAGDTRFVMTATLSLAAGLLVLPSYVMCQLWGGGVLTAWCLVTIYVVALCAAFVFRFQGGAWRTMRVIEPATGGALA